MAAGSSPSETRGIFINSGTAMSGRVTLHSVAMPPLWTHSPMVKPSMTAPDWTESLAIALPPDRKAIGQPVRQAVLADPGRGRLDIIGHATIGDGLGGGIEHRKRGGRVAIA